MQTTVLSEKDVIANSFYFNTVKSAEDYLVLASALIYLFFAYMLNQNYKRWLVYNTSDTQLSELRFVKNLLIWFIIISLYTITNLLLNELLDPSTHDARWHISHLLIASLVYYMGLVGYKNSDIIPQDFRAKSNEKIPGDNEDVDMDLIAVLNTAIENEKVHLNSKLSLQDLAKTIDVNETLLSNTINAHYKKNFRSFINDLRVEEVKDRLLNDGLEKLSLLGLAKECGFNSEASFYRIFRATTGLTPKQFFARHSPNSKI